MEVEQLANQKWAAEMQRQKGEEEEKRKVREEEEAHARWEEEERRREEALGEAQARWEEEWEERRREMEEEREEEVQRLVEEFEMKSVLQQAEMEEEHRGREREAVAEKNEKIALLEVQIHHLQQQLADATGELEQAAAKAARAHTTSLAALRSMPQGEVVAEMEVAKAEAERLQERLSKANLLTEVRNN